MRKTYNEVQAQMYLIFQSLLSRVSLGVNALLRNTTSCQESCNNPSPGIVRSVVSLCSIGPVTAQCVKICHKCNLQLLSNFDTIRVRDLLNCLTHKQEPTGAATLVVFLFRPKKARIRKCKNSLPLSTRRFCPFWLNANASMQQLVQIIVYIIRWGIIFVAAGCTAELG